MRNTKNAARQSRMWGSTKESMYIKVETIKHSNTWLEHQNNFQKAKHKLHLHNWQALQFIFRQTNKAQPTQAQRNIKKSKQRLYTQHHQKASKHQTLMHKEITPRFRSCQTLLGKLGIKVGSVGLWPFGDLPTQYPNNVSARQWRKAWHNKTKLLRTRLCTTPKTLKFKSTTNKQHKHFMIQSHSTNTDTF